MQGLNRLQIGALGHKNAPPPPVEMGEEAKGRQTTRSDLGKTERFGPSGSLFLGGQKSGDILG